MQMTTSLQNSLSLLDVVYVCDVCNDENVMMDHGRWYSGKTELEKKLGCLRWFWRLLHVSESTSQRECN